MQIASTSIAFASHSACHEVCLCRFIVRQQSQAVKVNDPVRLCQQLENLIGTAEYASLIAAKAKEASQQAALCQKLEESIEK